MKQPYEKLEKLREILGNEIVFMEFLNYFTSDQINKFCDSVATDYDVENEFED